MFYSLSKKGGEGRGALEGEGAGTLLSKPSGGEGRNHT